MDTAVVGMGTLIKLVAVEGLKKKNFEFRYSTLIVERRVSPLMGLYWM